MFKIQLCLLIGIFFVISPLEALGQQPKKCSDFNEYCQIHSDCCSNSCLTYLYKCTRNYNGIYPYTLFGEKYPSAGTVEDVLKFTFSNFGSVEEMKRHEEAHQTDQKPHGFGSRFGDNEISGSTQLSQEKEMAEPTPTATERITAEQPQQAAENSTKIESDNAFGETKVSEGAAACKEIGSKCYSNDECCTKRCHGFLHQCVT